MLVELINVIGCDEFASVESTSIKLVLVDKPAVLANPDCAAKVDIPARSENVANPALLASVARIEVDIVPVGKPVIITSLPMNTESLKVDLSSTVNPSSVVSPSTFKF